jgi:hypothetical protein
MENNKVVVVIELDTETQQMSIQHDGLNNVSTIGLLEYAKAIIINSKAEVAE